MMPEEEAAVEYAFTAPPGLTMPDDVQEGDSFEVVAKVRMEGGKIYFDQLNGVNLASEEEPMEEEEGEEVEVEEDVEGEESDDAMLMEAVKQSGY